MVRSRTSARCPSAWFGQLSNTVLSSGRLMTSAAKASLPLRPILFAST